MLAEVNADFTVAQYLRVQIFVTRFGYIMFAVFAAALSCVAGGYIKSVIISIAVLVIPFILSMQGITILDGLSFTGFVTSVNIVRDVPTFAILTVLTFALMAASFVKWAGRRLR